ncbi:MAG: hypothetical protein VX433_03240, partial [Candidatus Thermoplasmatota archaeon]|nr:hypothetical protein [Candidatus Thermoplasmatota archaeon]
MSLSEEMPVALPPMRNNPFPLRPLSMNDFGLLVGRESITERVFGWLTARSARMVLLVGERGSGRTSLLNVLGGLSSQHHYFSIYPTQDPVKSLLEELYVSVSGDFEIPPSLTQLRNNLVDILDSRTGKLPLISFDYPNLAGSSIAEMFKQTSQVLRVLNAVSILSLTPSQLNALPQELIDEYDEVLHLEPLSNEEIGSMISHRVSSVSREGWTADVSLVDELEEQTGGHVSKVMRLMRDVVHSTKQTGGIDPRLSDMFLSVKARMDISAELEESEDIELGDEIELQQSPDYGEYDEILPDEEAYEVNEIDEDNLSEMDTEPDLEQPADEVTAPSQSPPRIGAFGRLGSRATSANTSMRSDGIAVFPSD